MVQKQVTVEEGTVFGASDEFACLSQKVSGINENGAAIQNKTSK